MVDLLSKVAFLHLLLGLGRNWEIFVHRQMAKGGEGGGCWGVGRDRREFMNVSREAC